MPPPFGMRIPASAGVPTLPVSDLRKVVFNLTRIVEELTPSADSQTSKMTRGQVRRKEVPADVLRHTGLTDIVTNIEHIIYATARGFSRQVDVAHPERECDIPARETSLDVALMDWDTPLAEPGIDPLGLLRVIAPSFVSINIDPILPENFSYALCGWDVVFAFAPFIPQYDRSLVTPGQSVDVLDLLLKRIGHTFNMPNQADRIIFKHLIQLIGEDIENADCVTEGTAHAFTLLTAMVTVRAAPLPIGYHQTFRQIIATVYDNQFPTAADVAQYTFTSR